MVILFFVFLLLFGSLLFVLLMFLKYAAAMLVSVPLLCQFSVKMSFEKSISLWRYVSVHIFYARERKPLNTPTAICGAIFEFGFICTFADVFLKLLKLHGLLAVFMIVTSRKLSCLFSFRIQSCTILIDLD